MKRFLPLLILIFLIAPYAAFAVNCPTGQKDSGGVPMVAPNNLNLCYPSFGGFTLTLGLSLPQIIAWFYYFIVGISGFAAFIMILWGGISWLTSSGSPSKINEARDRIKNALIGLLIVLASYLILQLINPQLTVLTP